MLDLPNLQHVLVCMLLIRLQWKIVTLRPLNTDRLLVAVFLTQYSCLLQYMTEKMGGAEGTQMDVDFMDMERVNIIDVMLT